MLICPTTICLFRIQNTIGNLIQFSVVKINVVRTKSHRSAKKKKRQKYYVVFSDVKHLLTNAHSAPVILYHLDMPLAPGHVLSSGHSSRPALRSCKFYYEFLHAMENSCTIQQYPDDSIR